MDNSNFYIVLRDALTVTDIPRNNAWVHVQPSRALEKVLTGKISYDRIHLVATIRRFQKILLLTSLIGSYQVYIKKTRFYFNQHYGDSVLQFKYLSGISMLDYQKCTQKERSHIMSAVEGGKGS